MNKKKIKSIFICLILTFSFFTAFPFAQAASPHTVKGILYINDEIPTSPAYDFEKIIVKLVFTSETYNHTIYEHNLYDDNTNYNIGIYGHEEETADIIVEYYGQEIIPDDNQTITIQTEIGYIVDLHITVEDIDTQPPSKVTGLTVNDAKDGKLDLSWNPATDNVAVAYYNIYWNQNSYTTPITTVAHPTTTYQHTGLTNGQTYCYKISAVDTSDNEGEKSNSACGVPTASPTPNNAPDKPITPEPENNSIDVVLNPILSIYVQDSDGDSMTVTFKDASDDSIIGTAVNVDSANRAAVTWPGLSFNTTYNWYAVANDSEFETRSDVFCFKTIKEEDDDTAPVVFFETPQEGGLYIFGNNIFSGILKTPLIIGSLNIVVNATDNQSGISHVTLSIKGKWQNITQNLTTSPYTYEWSSFGFKTYNITATTYDNAGNSASTNIIVRKFL